MSAALQQKPEIKIRLTVVAGPYAGQIFQLNKPSFTIGRGPENDVVLMNDPQISRTHARIDVVDRDLEIVNLSQKNAVIVDGQKVQKWKIVNHSGFTIGDTVFSVEYDLGQAVVSVPAARPATVHPLKAKAPPKNGVTPKKPNLQKLNKAAQPLATRAAPPGLRAQVPGISPQVQMRPPGSQANNAFANARTAAPAGGSFMRNPRLKIYLILLILGGGVYYYLFGGDAKEAQKKISSTLRYEDTVAISMNSKAEKDRVVQLENRLKEKNSIQAQRIQENLMKGLRDFKLGNYVRAQEFFQLVLNLDPEHPLARRYFRLATSRFDEIVQEKLMLGESNFKKHNFSMCESLYRQVVVMLQGKNNDQNLLLAEKKAKECQLANEGIR